MKVTKEKKLKVKYFLKNEKKERKKKIMLFFSTDKNQCSLFEPFSFRFFSFNGVCLHLNAFEFIALP